MKRKILCSIFCAVFCSISASAAIAQIDLGHKLPTLALEGKEGERVADGKSWSSNELQGKVFTVMYVDPDKKDVNLHVESALKAENFPRDKFGSYAIINMQATWIPNSLIETKLKEKQEIYPHTIYVKDFKKVLVKGWGLEDDDYVVLAFDKKGKVLFHKAGKLSDEEVKDLISVIRKNL